MTQGTMYISNSTCNVLKRLNYVEVHIDLVGDNLREHTKIYNNAL